MSAISFRTTPKGDISHKLFILRKLEKLGTELKNLECYELGTMLHLDIQNGKEATKA